MHSGIVLLPGGLQIGLPGAVQLVLLMISILCQHAIDAVHSVPLCLLLHDAPAFGMQSRFWNEHCKSGTCNVMSSVV